MEKIQHALAKARAEREARMAELRAAEGAPAPERTPQVAETAPVPETDPAPKIAEPVTEPRPALAPKIVEVAQPEAPPPPPPSPEIEVPVLEEQVAVAGPDRESFIAPAPPPQDIKDAAVPVAEAREQTEISAPQSDSVSAWEAVEPFVISPAIKERNRIVALQEGRAGSEFDMLRTRVLQQMRANNWRRLAITSPTPACGKSTIALNLAFAISRQPDIHTVLLELDLRRPSLASALGVTAAHKFARVLDGSEPFSQHALRHGKNLMIATNRSASKHTSERLQAPAAARALAEIETVYAPDFMIMDMPPMLVSDDTIAFMNQVDCVLLVAAAETTTVKEIDLCERELSQHTNVMGVVLNKCRHMGPETGYGYYD